MIRPRFLLAAIMGALAAHAAGPFPIGPAIGLPAQKFIAGRCELTVARPRRRKTTEGRTKRKHRVVRVKFRKRMRYGQFWGGKRLAVFRSS